MTDTWFTSDTHFGHANMLKFENKGKKVRPGFADVDEMNELMIERWNSVVKPGDTIYHLGDIGFGPETLPGILDRLNGNKNLALGNHDMMDMSFYSKFFNKIRSSFKLGKFGVGLLLTHVPVHPGSLMKHPHNPCINVHGHLHANEVGDPRYVNVSVEQIDYTPIHYDALIAKAKELS